MVSLFVDFLELGQTPVDADEADWENDAVPGCWAGSLRQTLRCDAKALA